MPPRRPSAEGGSLTFAEVFPKELQVLEKARQKRETPRSGRPLKNDLIGLAFSGGGIRSATFNLGVIQALASHSLLRRVDYLSTVSGGGYIGSWLSSWAYYIHEQAPANGENHIGQIEDILDSRPAKIGDVSEPHQIHFLRKYSNYLTPRLGILSGDTLAFVATYLRNLLLNQTILISALLALLLVPQALGLAVHHFNSDIAFDYGALAAVILLLIALPDLLRNVNSDRPVSSRGVFWWLVVRLFLLCILAFYIGYAAGVVVAIVSAQILIIARSDTPDSSRAVFWRVVVPLFLFCVLISDLMWQLRFMPIFDDLFGVDSFKAKLIFVTTFAFIYALFWMVAALSVDKGKVPYLRWAPTLWALPTGIIGGCNLLVLILLISRWHAYHSYGVWNLITYGIPLVTLSMLVVGAFHLGLIGREYPDGLREWWSRLGGEILGIAVCWFLFSIVTLFVPIWLEHVRLYVFHTSGQRIWRGLSALGITGAVTGWIGATLKGLLSAKSGATGLPSGSAQQDNANASKSKTADLAARVAPPVFAAGLLIALSYVLFLLCRLYFGVPVVTRAACYGAAQLPASYLKVIAICVVLYGISRIIGYRVDVNEFSLHNAYRNRLVRCYLGATHEGRRPQPFTGFDEKDNIYLARLVDLGIPFHILNATLNVVKGQELALQARKARSFTFTPLYSGFDYAEEESVREMPDSMKTGDDQPTNDPGVIKPGTYRLTENCSHRSPYPGARLGTAMAISGAAVSPNMGHYTSGPVSFLLAIFSVRLGWWMGNPRSKKDWESGSPRSSWRALINELTGNTTDDRPEVYLSDGGHFDNLGLYELIRRRCRVIIASDAGADPSCACNDLATVIEKCRVDFGTHIKMQTLEDISSKPEPIFPGDVKLRISKSPFASGTIEYPDGSQGALIYIKPSLNASLPQDVLAYARLAQAFPHQSTLDQFFDEAQFESYRALGHACAQDAIGAINAAIQGEPQKVPSPEQTPK